PVIPADPPPGAAADRAVPVAAGGGSRRGAGGGGDPRAQESGRPGGGQAGAGPRGPVLHLRGDAGRRGNEKPGGAGEPARGDRPAPNARDTRGGRAAVV